MAVVKEMEKPADSSVQGGETEPKSRARTSSLPKPANKTLTPEEFYSYTAAMSESDWAHTMIYVFRQWPRIIREPKNIEKITTPVTEERLLETHGSGKYWLMLNDTDTDKTVTQTYPDLDSPNYPPRIDLRELDVAHEKNRTYVDHLKRMGKLTMEGDIVQPGKSESNGEAQAIKEIALEAMRSGQNKPGLETKAFEKMMDMMSTASSKSIEIAMGQVKKEDPAAFMQLVLQMSQSQNQSMAPIMAMLTTLMTKMFDRDSKPAGPDPMIGMMMEQLKAAREDAAAARVASEAALQRAHEKEMALMENRAEAVDPLAMVEKVLTLQDKLGGGGAKDWKAMLVEQGMSHLPEAFSLAERAIGYRMSQTVNPPPPPRQPANPPQQTTPPGAPVKQSPPPVSDDPDIVWLHQIFLNQGPMFVNAFRADPENGAGLAMALEDMGLKPLYTRASAMGPVKILNTIKLIPQMQADAMAIGTQSMLDEFVQEFCNPPDDDDSDEPEEPVIPEGHQERSATRPVPAAPKPTKKAGKKK
jgi:hypothetical protein